MGLQVNPFHLSAKSPKLLLFFSFFFLFFKTWIIRLQLHKTWFTQRRRQARCMAASEPPLCVLSRPEFGMKKQSGLISELQIHFLLRLQEARKQRRASSSSSERRPHWIVSILPWKNVNYFCWEEVVKGGSVMLLSFTHLKHTPCSHWTADSSEQQHLKPHDEHNQFINIRMQSWQRDKLKCKKANNKWM